MEENKKPIAITVLDSRKGFAIFSLVFIFSAFIGIGLPFIFGGSEQVIVIAAILFFAIPFITFPFIKKICIRKAALQYKPHGLVIAESNGEDNIIVNWDQVGGYRLTPFNNLAGKGFLLKLNCRDGSSVKIAIIDKDVWSITNNNGGDSLLSGLCKCINNYNKTQVNEGNMIALLPGFFASKPGYYLIWISIILVIFDLIYRASHPLVRKMDVFFFLFIAFFILSVFGQSIKSRRFFKGVQNLHGGGIVEGPVA